MLVNTPDVTGPLAILIGLGCVLLVVSVIAVIRSQRRSPAAGRETLIGSTGTVRTTLAPEGTIHVQGELWQATTDGEQLEPGTRVVVTGARGLRLIAKKQEGKDD